MDLSTVGIRSSAKNRLLRSSSYTDAEGWDDLVHVFTESLKHSSLDEMILLLHHTTPLVPHVRRSEYVRPVFYNTLDEIPQLLLSTAPGAWKTGAAPAYQQIPHVETTAADWEEAEVIASDEDEEETSLIQFYAAKAIQDAYRRHLEWKSIVGSRIDPTQAHYWDLLRKRSSEMELSKDSRYYLLFRVPLAYVLVSLDAIKAFVESEKKGANKRMMAEDDENLEELIEALDRYRYDSVDHTLNQGSNKSFSKLLKKTIALQKKLTPSSKFHKGRSVSDLQRAVLEVKAIVESLDSIPGSTETRNKIQECWDRGWKWILEKEGSRAKGKKAEKPKLIL